MSLNPEERKSVVTLEYEKACKTFNQVERLAEENMWDFVANRLYYALFHAVLALLINDGHSAGTHRGVVAMFGMHYVKTGIFSTDDGKLYSRLQTMREESDYNCAYQAEETDIRPNIEKVGLLIAKIRNHLSILD